jgi:hypothetical protein
LRQRIEGGAEAHLDECVDPARHEALATELAREIRVTLEERDANAPPREEIGERRSRRAGTDYHRFGHVRS